MHRLLPFGNPALIHHKSFRLACSLTEGGCADSLRDRMWTCMDRRLPDQANSVACPNIQPKNGDAVVAEYNGELIIRQYFRGASVLILSPDSNEDGFEDIVFDDPETQTVELRGVIKWYQASRVKRV